MSRENAGWGGRRIQSELALRGHVVSEATVRNYSVRIRKPPSQTWRTFLDNHLSDIAAVDFFTVPTASFRILFAFVVRRHDRRHVVHFNDTAPRFLIRDRDGIYGDMLQQRVRNMGIEEIVCAAQAPWQNPYCDRLIGSVRRKRLNHVIILNERHLLCILRLYLELASLAYSSILGAELANRARD